MAVSSPIAHIEAYLENEVTDINKKRRRGKEEEERNHIFLSCLHFRKILRHPSCDPTGENWYNRDFDVITEYNSQQ